VPAVPVVYRPAPVPAPAPPQRSRGAIAAAFGGLLIAGALSSVESVLAARIVTTAPAPAVVRPALPAPPPAVNVVPPPVENAETVPPETESEPAPKSPPKPWAGLQSSVPRADVPALPQVPTPDPIAPQLPGAWAAPPIAAGPRRIAFEGGIITFFAASIVIADKKHPQGISLPAHGADYTCESKSRSCTLAAGGTRLRVRHAADYKLLVDCLIQTR